jgi:hypothetical protein
MHFSARTALLASCLAITVQALPVTYSVVDVDGGSAANGASGSADQPATIYQTVTKSQDVEEPEPTTVSVSVTIVETQHASATSTSVSSSSSLSGSTSSSTASAQASSSASSPAATATDTQSALSIFESASSTFLTRHTSIVSTPSAKPTITQAPAVSASQAPPSSSSECEASSVTVTDEVTEAQTVTATQVTSERSTVVLLSTTTITPAAAPTSYYDDGMWHTRYAIKPAASPSPEPVVPATKDDDAAPEVNKPSKPVDDKPAHVHPNAAANATSQAGDATNHARRELDPVAPTPTVPAVAAAGVPEVSGAPLMLVQPLRQDVPGTAAPSDVSTADAADSLDVLSVNDDIATGKTAKREATYNVVSWNETSQG